ncbi:hypothetical protein Msi02_14730 [Microbispora siamensis]|uniref:Uncharacterized protein n=1 Tax=Microbispora siamensis TaxID=564413 RepID=A0ABQ4GGW3_9ACTN|nr:hypothetical protein Msi02_14730 [Microbispora siamensis]
MGTGRADDAAGAAVVPDAPAVPVRDRTAATAVAATATARRLMRIISGHPKRTER